MKKILIVDDNPQNLYLLEILLKTHGYEVEQATNGIEALEIARANPPNIIISDILMPGMDGFSLCRSWKTDERLKNIPFVVYTATYTDPKDEKFALSLGAERFIVKPMEPDEFIMVIREIIQEHEVGGYTASQGSIEKEDEYYKEYSETLIRKLENKMIQTQEINKRLASLYQASCDLTSIQDLSDIIHHVLRALVDTAGYQQADYFQFDLKQKKLSLLDAIGFPEETIKIYKEKLNIKLGQEQGLVGLTAQEGRIINVPDISKEPRWVMTDPAIQSALSIPVIYERQLFGVILLCSAEKNAFTPEDERNISTLANSLAIAIENENNRERVQKQLQHLSALHNIDLAIKGSTDLNAVLNIFLDHLTKQLNIDAADVLLYNSTVLTYELAARRGFNTRAIDNQELRREKSPAERVIIDRRTIHLSQFANIENSPLFTALCKAEGFSDYFGTPLIVKGEVKGVLEAFHRTPFDPDAEWIEFFETLAGQAAIAIDNAEMFDGLLRSNIELRLAYDATIEGWSRVVNLRLHETESRAQEMVELTVQLARSMGINDAELVHIQRGVLLHDLGMIGVPDAVLFKAEALTEGEWVEMRKHPLYAFEMLSPIKYLQKALDIPYCHHEKWDGTGYPRGLKGERIPLVARIFAIVDVWDALRSNRPFRKAWHEDKALEYIREQSGKHFDPAVVRAFLNLLTKKEIQ
ncbi:MAG: GAF domain-containing protein [Anaerolineales bacterium]|nr:GAF domain-containing protein [Anaerolineales bacterium]